MFETKTKEFKSISYCNL